VPEKVLLVSSRFPWPPITGDRSRTLAWLQALAPRADVTLTSPPGHVPLGAPSFRFVPARRPIPTLAAAFIRALSEQLPLTSLLAAGPTWGRAIRRAESAVGQFDACVVLLARLDPWVFRHLRAPCLILDAIDSLAKNLDQRAAASQGLVRAWWRWEGRRTRRLERDAATRYDRVLVVAEAERTEFGERAEAVFHGIDVGPTGSGARDFDVGFWGRLAYFANRDAVRVLMREIWPQVRARRPDARLLIAGADAPRWIAALHGREGVCVVSPMDDRSALLRRVKVALFPVRFGSGQSIKVLEAAEASCALVATPEAVRSLGAIGACAAIATAPSALVAHVLDLLADDDARRTHGRALREVVERHYSREVECRRFGSLVLGGCGDPGITA
jgi:glycosyltransferase involved in cell wall biosynthesis